MIWIIESPVASTRRRPPRGRTDSVRRSRRPPVTRASTIQRPGRDARTLATAVLLPAGMRRPRQLRRPAGGRLQSVTRAPPTPQRSRSLTAARPPARTLRRSEAASRLRHDGVTTSADELSWVPNGPGAVATNRRVSRSQRQRTARGRAPEPDVTGMLATGVEVEPTCSDTATVVPDRPRSWKPTHPVSAVSAVSVSGSSAAAGGAPPAREARASATAADWTLTTAHGTQPVVSGAVWAPSAGTSGWRTASRGWP
jgi:hypothetical protein